MEVRPVSTATLSPDESAIDALSDEDRAALAALLFVLRTFPVSCSPDDCPYRLAQVVWKTFNLLRDNPGVQR